MKKGESNNKEKVTEKQGVQRSSLSPELTSSVEEFISAYPYCAIPKHYFERQLAASERQIKSHLMTEH